VLYAACLRCWMIRCVVSGKNSSTATNRRASPGLITFLNKGKGMMSHRKLIFVSGPTKTCTASLAVCMKRKKSSSPAFSSASGDTGICPPLTLMARAFSPSPRAARRMLPSCRFCQRPYPTSVITAVLARGAAIAGDINPMAVSQASPPSVSAASTNDQADFSSISAKSRSRAPKAVARTIPTRALSRNKVVETPPCFATKDSIPISCEIF